MSDNIQLSKFGNIHIFVTSNSRSFIPQILKVVSPLGKKLIYFSPLGFVIQKNYDSEMSGFKPHSFRAFEQHQFFNSVHIAFECTSVEA